MKGEGGGGMLPFFLQNRTMVPIRPLLSVILIFSELLPSQRASNGLQQIKATHPCTVDGRGDIETECLTRVYVKSESFKSQDQ
jgi:hypothetical protein